MTTPYIIFSKKHCSFMRPCVAENYGFIRYELPFINALAVEVPDEKVENLKNHHLVAMMAKDMRVSKLPLETGSCNNINGNSSFDNGSRSFNAQHEHTARQSRKNGMHRSNASLAFMVSETRGFGITIAVIDTGVAPHYDLVKPYNRIIAFKDFLNHRTAPYDDDGHGTHVAGIAAGNAYMTGGEHGAGAACMAGDGHGAYAAKTRTSHGMVQRNEAEAVPLVASCEHAAPPTAAQRHTADAVTGNSHNMRGTIKHGSYGHGADAACMAGGELHMPSPAALGSSVISAHDARFGRFAGTAPMANIAALKVLDENGNGAASDILAAMQWVADNKERYNIRIVNLSLGVNAYDELGIDPLAIAVTALTALGIVVVTAAGNSGPSRCSIASPGTAPAAITVGACHNGEVAGFSSRGPTLQGVQKPDLVAPGVDIISLDAATGKTYIAESGTSMACPYVAGAAACILSAAPSLSPPQVKRVLYRMLEPLPGAHRTAQGHGALIL